MYRFYKILKFPFRFKGVWCGLHETEGGLRDRQAMLYELFPEYETRS